MEKSLYPSEIYSAIQGEGPLVGIRQIFLRLSGCDLRCKWCDTPQSLNKLLQCSVEQTMGERDFKIFQNPISFKSLFAIIKELSPQFHHSLAITGGEPLLQAEPLNNFLAEFKKQFTLPVYLETGGHRYKELKDVIHLIDYISMDIKIPSSGTSILWEEHKRFLEICAKSNFLGDYWVKLVFSADTLFDELLFAVNLVKSFIKNKSPVILLQPVTESNGVMPPGPMDLLTVQKKLLLHYPNIRVIPQVHVLMSQK